MSVLLLWVTSFLGFGDVSVKAVNVLATITDTEAQRIVDGLVSLGLTRDNMQYIIAKNMNNGIFGIFYIRNNVPGSSLTLVEQLPSENVSGSGSQIFYHQILVDGSVTRVCSTAQCYMNNFLLGSEWAVVEANLPVSTQYGSWVFEYNAKITALWQTDEEGLTNNDRGFLSGLFNGIFNFFGDLVDNLIGFSHLADNINTLITNIEGSFGELGTVITFPIRVIQSLIGGLSTPSCTLNMGAVQFVGVAMPFNFSVCEWGVLIDVARGFFAIEMAILCYKSIRTLANLLTGNF